MWISAESSVEEGSLYFSAILHLKRIIPKYLTP